MTRNKIRLLTAAVLLIAMVQMPQIAISPVINQMKTDVFPAYKLSAIQTAIVLSSLVSPAVSIISATLIRRGLLSKRTAVSSGLFILGLVGLLSFFANTQFWHVAMLSVLTGCALGCYLSNTTSVMMDNFPIHARQKITGIQTVFINVGGILFSLLGSAFAQVVWHGAYRVFLAGLPLAVLAYFAVPPGKFKTRKQGGGKPKLNLDIFYYAAVLFFFMLMFGTSGANLSTHLSRSGFDGTKSAGIASAVQMVGGGVLGALFGSLSKKIADFCIATGFFLAFIGFTVLNLFHFSLIMVCFGTFLIGAAFSMTAPQCMISTAARSDVTTSATAMAIVAGLAPSFGGFFSPIFFTGITTALFGDSTRLRFQFIGYYSLILALAFGIFTVLRSRNDTQKGAVTP